MAKHNKKIMNHHKRNHNGRQRARKDDVPKSVDCTYFRPCGCRPEDVPARNKAIAHAIRMSRPIMEWSATLGRWVPTLPSTSSAALGAACATSTSNGTWIPTCPPSQERLPEVSKLTENGELKTQID
jgi:hypothetical protein